MKLLRAATLSKMELQHWCFPMNIVKSLRITLIKNSSRRHLLYHIFTLKLAIDITDWSYLFVAFIWYISSKNMPKNSIFINWIWIPTSIFTLLLKVLPQSFCELLIRMTSNHCLMWHFSEHESKCTSNCTCLNSFMTEVPLFPPQINGMVSICRDLRHVKVNYSDFEYIFQVRYWSLLS